MNEPIARAIPPASRRRILAAVALAAVLAACSSESTPTEDLPAEGDDPLQEASEALT